jgi:hypothetical protein
VPAAKSIKERPGFRRGEEGYFFRSIPDGGSLGIGWLQQRKLFSFIFLAGVQQRN